MNSQGEALAHRFFRGTGKTYDLMVNLGTFGFDRWWKKRIVDKVPAGPHRILDQACGTGILTFKIARAFPGCQLVGIDLHTEYISIAREKAATRRLNDVLLIIGRAEDVLLNTGFDCITSSYLAKYAGIEELVKNAKRMLQDQGTLVVHDFTYPSDRRFARLWEFYFRLLQTVGSRIYPQWRTVFYELPQLLRRTVWVTELVDALQKNAFADITVEFLTFGTSALVTATKTSPS
ncbi:MAG: class I SAM-dependent methyltransferase [Deltaproteobacteria bacterium]|jgi:demethylmenaquinone methyltransferase/2-methoxy-6-polyprenyl-1,4-benzoquinol methylase